MNKNARILNIGSMNVDHVYSVEHFVRPGETLDCVGYRQFAGGKGLNQSIALAHAGAHVYHAGKIGKDGNWLADLLEKHGVNVDLVQTSEAPGGHAVIQVNAQGENSIVIYGGANRMFTEEDINSIVSGFAPGDCLLVQNETNNIPAMFRKAAENGLTVVFNPAPMNDEVREYPLDLVDIFIVNRTEAEELFGENKLENIADTFRCRYPGAAAVVTLGGEGCLYADPHTKFHCPAIDVSPEDTTAAGDTFTGFFLAELMNSQDPGAAAELACRAAAVCVTRAGAANSIPSRGEIGE